MLVCVEFNCTWDIGVKGTVGVGRDETEVEDSKQAIRLTLMAYKES